MYTIFAYGIVEKYSISKKLEELVPCSLTFVDSYHDPSCGSEPYAYTLDSDRQSDHDQNLQKSENTAVIHPLVTPDGIELKYFMLSCNGCDGASIVSFILLDKVFV